MDVQDDHVKQVEVTLLIWNVWNLPSWLTDNKSKTRAMKISPLLNDYDVVVLNEAFVNQKSLLEQTLHPYRYIPPKSSCTLFSSGLIFLSKYEITNTYIETFTRRSGVDRFAAKGIAQVMLKITRDGRNFGQLRIFGTHMQASHGPSAQRARNQQALQTSDLIQRFMSETPAHMTEIPTILVGDLNMGPHLGADEPYSQHYHDATDHVARTNAYHKLSSYSGLDEVSQFLYPIRDEHEYSREICRVLGNARALQKHSLAYELQNHTDGSDRLSDTKALCFRLSVSTSQT